MDSYTVMVLMGSVDLRQKTQCLFYCSWHGYDGGEESADPDRNCEDSGATCASRKHWKAARYVCHSFHTIVQHSYLLLVIVEIRAYV